MTFLIVTHVPHKYLNGAYYGYGPYIREMNLWIKDADEVLIVASVDTNAKPDPIDLAYIHPAIKFIEVPAFSLVGARAVFTTLLKMPGIFLNTFRAMRKADHIHLRCPGNMGLIGLFVQVLFPAKKKTVKYAGNWDDYQGEHRTYKMQKSIAKNRSLSRNTQVLIYGQWPNFTKNCLAFFTASYRENDKRPILAKSMKDDEVKIIFLGTLDERKRPEYAVEVISILTKRGFNNISLDIVGEGPFESLCREKIAGFGLQDRVTMHGNVAPSEVANFLNRSHL
ncbi:MAG: glycosyltransferase, partial [Ferruginibacter sp.]